MISVIIVTGKVKCFCCNNPSDSITEIVRLEPFDYYNQKQNEVLYVNMENMDLLPPASFSRARLTRPLTSATTDSYKIK